jgi:hypothetical protein
MRSQVRFVMHPDDEPAFVQVVTTEVGTVFVDGTNWPTPRPPITNDLQTAGNYLMIWNPHQTPKLTATHFRNEDEEWWNCKNEFVTIQFLRSGFQYGEPFLFEGSIAVGTTDMDKSFFHEPSAPAVEERFKALRKFIKKAYTNKAIIWQSMSAPRSNTIPHRPDASLWVGPRALIWLGEKPKKRWVQQSRFALTRGYLLDLFK